MSCGNPKLQFKYHCRKEEKIVKKFLAIYLGSPNSAGFAKWNALDDDAKKRQEKAGMLGWMNWAKQNEESIVEMGGPLGKTKKADPKGISDTKNEMSAFTIVEAESHEAAAKMFVNHPHFTIFPGDSIEIMECLPIPKM